MRNFWEPTVWARQSSSWTPMIETSAESLIIAMNSLPIAGMTIRTACGRTTRRIVSRVGHPECARRLDLAARDGLDAGPEDLGHVRAVVEGERHDPQHDQRDLGEPSRDLGQGQVDEQDLDDQRRAAHEGDVELAIA